MKLYFARHGQTDGNASNGKSTADFILVGQKLEQLGFTYYKGRIMTIDLS